VARRIAIIGGGPAGLAAAFDLALRNDGDDIITVYQAGWRLGGKCSTGRDPATGQIHEHGLHVFGGFYHNSWRQIRLLYRHWQDDGAAPVSFDEAFLPVNGCILTEPDGHIIPIALPPLDQDRDFDQKSISSFDLVSAMIVLIAGQLAARFDDLPPPIRLALAPIRKGQSFWVRQAIRLLRTAIPKDEAIPRVIRRAAARALALFLRPARDALQFYVRTRSGSPEMRDGALLGAFAAVVAIGLLEDDMLPDRFDRVNGEEATDWLRRHGAQQELVESAYVRAAYDYAFAYGDGVTNPPRRAIAAGTAVHGYLNLVLTYSKSLFYHFNGGTAEMIAAPYYEVLKAKGVRFAFFHRIDGIELDPTGTRIACVTGMRQARPLAGPFGYAPLIDHGGRKCWPTDPRYADLHDGHALRDWLVAEGLTLETDGVFADYPTAEPFVLTDGADGDDGFTHLVLAVPPRVLDRVAAPLVAHDPAWQRALETARQCPTIAVELRGHDPLGGATVLGALLTAHIQPFGTWADMSFLAQSETGDPTSHLSYLCGVWPSAAPNPGERWQDFVAREIAAAEALTHSWNAAHLEATLRAGLGRPTGPIPTIDSVTVRVNLGLSEGYVQSPAGSIDARLPAGATGYANLFVAGDWTRSGIEAGCYEAALLSGLTCADAVLAA